MVVQRFRKRPGFVGIQFDGTNDREIKKLTGAVVDFHRYPGPNDVEEAFLEFGEDRERVNFKDYIWNYYGEWRITSAEAFEGEYEPLDSQ